MRSLPLSQLATDLLQKHVSHKVAHGDGLPAAAGRKLLQGAVRSTSAWRLGCWAYAGRARLHGLAHGSTWQRRRAAQTGVVVKLAPGSKQEVVGLRRSCMLLALLVLLTSLSLTYLLHQSHRCLGSQTYLRYRKPTCRMGCLVSQ